MDRSDDDAVVVALRGENERLRRRLNDAIDGFRARVARVRELHEPQRHYLAHRDADVLYANPEEASKENRTSLSALVPIDLCRHCKEIEADAGSDDYSRAVMWPCATIRALDRTVPAVQSLPADADQKGAGEG